MIAELFHRLYNWVEGEAVYPQKPHTPPAPDAPSTVRPAPSDRWLGTEQGQDIGVPARFLRWVNSDASRAAFRRIYNVCAIVLCVCMTLVLLETVSFLPKFGEASNPVNNEVPQRYIEQGLEETGATNIVSGMILDYRAFDTLGESNVLFAAMCSVTILLRTDYVPDGKRKKAVIPELEIVAGHTVGDSIVRSITVLLAPVLLMVGIYIVLNGHLSAGGGFSGGAVLGALLILLTVSFGRRKVERYFSARVCKWITFASLITYAALKSYSFYTGANHLESGIPLGKPGAILSGGLILPLNICVGCVVACTMYSFYALFRNGGISDGTEPADKLL